METDQLRWPLIRYVMCKRHMGKSKAFTKLSVTDLEQCPVWEFKANGRSVSPVDKLPVRSLRSRVVGLEVHLANGDTAWATLLNLSIRSPDMNPHLLTLRVERDGEWFTLARYFDSDADDFGPAQLARFLHLPKESVFPISYDLTEVAEGPDSALRGQVVEEITNPMPLQELMQFVVKKHAV